MAEKVFNYSISVTIIIIENYFKQRSALAKQQKYVSLVAFPVSSLAELQERHPQSSQVLLLFNILGSATNNYLQEISRCEINIDTNL